MRKCCGRTPELKTYNIPARAAGPDTPGWKAQTAYWYECKSCGMSNSFSYGSAKEAETAWGKGLTGRHQS